MAEQITTLPTAAQRNDAKATFSTESDQLAASLTPFVNEANALGAEANTNATNAEADADSASANGVAAEGNANAKGEWSNLTGALNVPATVEHNDTFWQLISDLTDVTTKEPGVDVEWIAIGNVSNLQASKLANPSLHILKKNALTEVIAGSLTWTRNLAGTYIDRYGVVKTGTINTAREEAEGWLIEGASTNLVLRSEEFDNATWNKTNATILTDNADAPDGATTAEKIHPTTTGTTRGAEQSIVANTNAHSFSAFVKPGGFQWVVISRPDGAAGVWFDVINGVVGVESTGATGVIKKVSDGYFRCTVTGISSASNFVAINLADSDGSATATVNGTDGLFIWGAQLEELPFASSYIPTVASTVARGADLVSAQLADNAPLLESPITIFARFDLLGFSDSDSQVIAHLGITSSVATGHVIAIDSSGTGDFFTTVRSSIANITPAPATSILEQSVALTYDGASTAAFYLDSALKTGATVGSATGKAQSVFIGSRNTGDEAHLFGHINDFRIYDFALNADQVKFLGGS